MTEKEKKILLQPKEKQHIFESNRKYFTISIYALFVITIGAFIVYLIMNWNATSKNISHFFNVLSPFFGAFFIAYLLNPFVKWIHHFLHFKIFKEKAPVLQKFLSIIFAYIFALGLVGIFLTYVIPQIANSITDLSSLSSKTTLIMEDFNNYINNLDKKYPTIDFSTLKLQIQQLSPQFLSFGTNFVTNIVPLLFTVSVNIVRWIINILLSIVISCYMLFDRYSLKHASKRLIYAFIPEKRADQLCVTLKECNSIFSGFIIGKSIDSLIIGLICLLLMTILQLPYALLLSVIVGVTNMIPYFGPFIGAIPGILLYLLINPIQAVIFAIMILCLQQFDGLYLGPKILGESTGLKPLWVIFAITVGGAYFGVLGMFLGVPVIAVIAYLLESFITKKLKENKIKNLD